MNTEVKTALAVELTKMKMQHIYAESGIRAFDADIWVRMYHESLEAIRQSEKEYAKQKPSVFD